MIHYLKICAKGNIKGRYSYIREMISYISKEIQERKYQKATENFNMWQG